MGRYVGLDAHSKRCVYAIEDETGKILAEGSFETNSTGILGFQKRHALPTGTPVALESGTMAFFVARQLRQIGLEPLVVDAREVRQKALRPNQKSDRRDALELCEGLRRGLYRTSVHVPTEPIEHLRDTLKLRRHFVRVKTMQVNAAKYRLRAAGRPTLARGLTTAKAWQKLLLTVAPDPALSTFLSAHRAVWQAAHEQVLAIEASLLEQAKPLESELARVRTIPGIGPIIGLTVLATFSDVHRFPSAKHAASYAGLVPSSYDSGERVRHGHITHRGSGELRSMLCEAAHHARRADHPLHPYFSSLCVRRGYKMAIVAVAHRLCRILYAMLRRGTDFDLQRLGIEEGVFEQTIVRRYRRQVVPA